MANSHDAPRRHYLREWREFRGLTQDDLSLLAGASQNEIADYETGERSIRLEMQFKLMWALGITAAHLFEPPPAAPPRRERDGSR
jgi:transcriptional regulator with XRE-family HTH domain